MTRATQGEIVELLEDTQKELEYREQQVENGDEYRHLPRKEAVLEYSEDGIGNERAIHSQVSEYIQQHSDVSGDSSDYELNLEDVEPEVGFGSIVKVVAESLESYGRGNPDDLHGFDTVFESAIERETDLKVSFFTFEEVAQDYLDNL
ncbi:MAG: hypothetical protein H8Z69_05780 [Nanohaloarchaea archaeon]|nr:hypothetical protein [Candidatus Nanohaloarchaea archaeon]